MRSRCILGQNYLSQVDLEIDFCKGLFFIGDLKMDQIKSYCNDCVLVETPSIGIFCLELTSSFVSLDDIHENQESSLQIQRIKTCLLDEMRVDYVRRNLRSFKRYWFTSNS